MTRKAFTLIELLLVITIIAILSAMMFPVFNKAKESARETQCLNNIKQLGMSLMMYMGDYDGVFPVAPIHENLMHPGEGELYCGHKVPKAEDIVRVKAASFRAQLEPYIKSQKIFICPSDNRNVAKDGNWTPNKRFMSYHYRFFMGARTANGNVSDIWTETNLPYPSRTFVIHEYLPFHQGEKEKNATSTKDDPWNWTADSRFYMVFGDGHTKSYTAGEAIPWNSDTKTYDYHWPKTFIGETWAISDVLWDIDK